MALWDSLISLGGQLLGGVGNFLGGRAANNTQMDIAQQNIELQKEFAQNGIRWRVADAQAAGVHPLFAMGAQTQPFQPVSVGQTAPDFSFLANMGQDISRAIKAAKTDEERENDTMLQTSKVLSLNRQGLENELLKSQIARIQSQMGPGMPSLDGTSPGGGRSGDVITSRSVGTYKNEPSEVTTTQPGHPGQAAGPGTPLIQWVRSADSGGLIAVPSKNIWQDDELGSVMATRVYLGQWGGPNLGMGTAPPMEMVRQLWPGATGVRWHYGRQDWVPIMPPKSFGPGRSPSYPSYNPGGSSSVRLPYPGTGRRAPGEYYGR